MREKARASDCNAKSLTCAGNFHLHGFSEHILMENTMGTGEPVAFKAMIAVLIAVYIFGSVREREREREQAYITSRMSG